MHVLIAPDKFAGTLTAVEAAGAIAAGWHRQAPVDTVELVPMADGGPGFVDVLHASLGGVLLPALVRGPFGTPVEARVLLVGETAYVESAQACGLHLTERKEPQRATTFGVGEMLLAALAAGARRIVLGAGGSGTTDGGAGMLAALGATADAPLDAGPEGLRTVTRVDLAPARARLRDIELVLASDVDNPLTGLFGCAKVYGPQKGLTEEELVAVDAVLERFAAFCDRRVSLAPGAGAAGGLGYATLLLGGTREAGLDVVAKAVGLEQRLRSADLVITGEGSFDFSSRAGKVPYGVAQLASAALRPCITVAGQVLIGSREMRALGMDAAYSMVELIGEERSFADPSGALTDLSARVARSWSTS
ncbi:glycerate kinase [Nocardioides gilvus]|uniref:glycerate kinase family protein n=1 Tax=Nocardioides gilvus TaxID=1735589 RepID=UPI000D74A496|nr:glycerate kinase [Nocardioides gilvus]